MLHRRPADGENEGSSEKGECHDNQWARVFGRHRGDEGRKAKTLSLPYSDQERRWIEEVVKSLIQRVGEIAGDPKGNHPKLTMANFPSLP